ncbi:hypothetical protein BS47DRAFT_1350147 [Hydnum rufescens UP504]|uniref:Uncharacterized protein n=1 Tax=Hydnum rufescens UP504 TaxID=1448309 RepID=A0A9P6AMZ5_9AGAM|nr:hypothetical protein BS47DRAFT_1350147 [Hydnum rufescens UP504]
MPQVTSIDHAQKLFKVADKFDVKRAAELLRAALTPFLAAELNPLRSWAIAVRYGVEEARRAAAKRFRPNTIRHPPKELAYVTALQYFQLLEGYGIY